MAYIPPPTDSSPASQTISAQDVVSTTTTGANSQSIVTGSATANSFASFSLASCETVSVQVTGTWTGTLVSEGSFDGGTTWYSKAIKQTGTAYTANNFTANFAGAINVASLTMYRLRATTTWTGTATIKISESANQHSTYIANNLALRDGTTQSVTNTIKPASTAPLATDTALVVTQSPNSPTATSANQTNGTQQTKITNGTNIADVLSGDTGFNSIASTSGIKTVPFTTSATGVQTLIADTDIRGYNYAEVILTSAGTGLAWSFSLAASSGGTYSVLPTGSWKQPGTNSTGLGVATGTWYNTALKGNYLRINITAMTAGTTTGFVILKAFPQSVSDGSNVNAAQFGTWNVGSSSATGTSIPANAFYQAINGNSGILTGVVSIGAQTDAATGFSILPAGMMLYNGTSEDKMRANTTGVVVAAGATATQTGVTFTTYNAKRLMILVNITAGAGTVTVAINGTSVSGYSTNLLTSTALTGAGTTALRIFDGATPSANLVANDTVPRTISITATVSGTITYGIDYILGI